MAAMEVSPLLKNALPLNLWVALGSMNILTILILSVHEHALSPVL